MYQKQKEYAQNNRDKINSIAKSYYQRHREEILKKKNSKKKNTECDEVRKRGRPRKVVLNEIKSDEVKVDDVKVDVVKVNKVKVNKVKVNNKVKSDNKDNNQIVVVAKKRGRPKKVKTDENNTSEDIVEKIK